MEVFAMELPEYRNKGGLPVSFEFLMINLLLIG